MRTFPRDSSCARTRSAPFRTVAALLVGLLAGPPAWAAGASRSDPDPARAPKPSIVVAAFPLDDASAVAAARVSWVGEQAARRAIGFEFQDLARLLDPPGFRARQEKAAEGKAAYEAAKKAYEELEVQKAAEECDRSLRAWEKADLTQHLDSLVSAWTLRIAALLANAQAKAAMAELNLLLPVGAKAVFDPNAFTPDFLAQMRAKRDDFAKKADLSVQVTSKPAPARIFVDGTFRGITPLEVKGLSPGDHFVTFVAPGYAQLQKRMRAGPGAGERGLLEPGAKLGGYLGRIDQLGLRASLVEAAEFTRAVGEEYACRGLAGLLADRWERQARGTEPSHG